MSPALATRPTPTVCFGDVISDGEFARIRDYLHEAAGIDLAPTKKKLVTARLSKRLRHFGLATYGEYFELATGGAHPKEPQVMVDLLTTNETYFFREPSHFDFLAAEVQRSRPRRPFRVWSAASSTGEEAYSIAMVLADQLGTALVSRPWEVMGSDISTRVLEVARKGHYSMARTDGIPRDFLKKYCLRGVGPQDGTLLIDAALRKSVRFTQVNLKAALPELGEFDLIFLRNVLIYFNSATKKDIVRRVLGVLRPEGHLLIGHSETLTRMGLDLTLVAPTVYRKNP